MRITEMLGRELCVVSEEIPLDNPYRGFLHSDCPERLAEQCRLLLADGRWRGAGELSAAKFRAEMSVVDVCKPVVDATLSRIVQ